MSTFGKILKFRLERWIQRGIFHQLLFMTGLIVAVAIGGGLVAWTVTDSFEHAFDAIWWAFLRLTDPGYLGDDEGLALRTVSTVVTVLGYVLFMGSMIAIMTQWLARTLRQLESGLTPISMRAHVVVLGWTDRTAEVVLQLLGARGRLKRFLSERGVRVLRIVVLADDVNAERRQELRDHVGSYWKESQVFLRSGSSLEIEDLERLDLRRAAAIVVPGADFELGGAELTDTRAVKTLLTVRRILRRVPLEERPSVVAEVFDPRKVAIAQSVLPEHLEVLASDSVIGRLISQSIRHPRLAAVFLELLTSAEGNSLYVRRLPELAGVSVLSASALFPRARVLGALRLESGRLAPHLNPPPGFLLEPDDLVVLVARHYEDCVPADTGTPGLVPQDPPRPREPGAPAEHRVLVLGWSYRATAILEELAASGHERVEVTTVSRVPAEDRRQALAHVDLDQERVTVKHVEGDYAVVGFLEGLDLERFGSIVFIASAGMHNSEEADARTVLGYVLLRSRLTGGAGQPQIIVELLDPANGRVFEDSEDVMLVSARILSHLVAHVCLRPELNAVYNALFVAEGPEFALRGPEEYGLAGHTLTFARIGAAAREHGEIGLGILLANGEREARLHLNPAPDSTWTLGPDDELVVLASETAG